MSVQVIHQTDHFKLVKFTTFEQKYLPHINPDELMVVVHHGLSIINGDTGEEMTKEEMTNEPTTNNNTAMAVCILTDDIITKFKKETDDRELHFSNPDVVFSDGEWNDRIQEVQLDLLYGGKQ